MCYCKKEDLRPCVFTLEGHNVLGFARPSMLEYENEEQREEATRKRQGLFHCFGTELQPRTTEGHAISCGIVEDCADGTVYRVNPDNIQFTDI